jgi:uncharacterized membrane protein
MEFLSRLHPLIVHFPIALLFSYVFWELGGLLFKKEFIHSTAFIILVSGVFFALISALTGNQAFEILRPTLKSKSIGIVDMIETHEQFATFTLWYFFALMILRAWLLIKKKFNYNWKIVCLLLGSVGCYLIIRTGILGGQLVYEFGIGTKIFLK